MDTILLIIILFSIIFLILSTLKNNSQNKFSGNKSLSNKTKNINNDFLNYNESKERNVWDIFDNNSSKKSSVYFNRFIQIINEKFSTSESNLLIDIIIRFYGKKEFWYRINSSIDYSENSDKEFFENIYFFYIDILEVIKSSCVAGVKNENELIDCSFFIIKKFNEVFFNNKNYKRRSDFIVNYYVDYYIEKKRYTLVYRLIEAKIAKVDFSIIHDVEYNLKKKVITGELLIENLGLKSFLNRFIAENIEEYSKYIDNKIDEIYAENYSFFHALFGKLKSVEEINLEFPIDVPTWMEFKDEFREENNRFVESTLIKEPVVSYLKVRKRFPKLHKSNWLVTDYSINYGPSIFSLSRVNSYLSFNNFLEVLLQEIFSSIILNYENEFRNSIGIPNIGEGWVNETYLYQEIKKKNPKLKVVQHGKPKWLGRQHVDIWLPEFKIGIEYQGRQHFMPIKAFGGEVAFNKIVERDEKKRVLFKKNDAYLIEVLEGYEFEEVQNEIQKIISYSREIILPLIDNIPTNSKQFNVINDYHDKSLIVVDVSKKNKLIGADTKIYDCKNEKIITKEELFEITEGKANFYQLLNRDSIYGRFILNRNKEENRVFKQWKNIIDTQTNIIERHNLETFAVKLKIKPNNVWNFFNGKQKKFKKRYVIVV